MPAPETTYYSSLSEVLRNAGAVLDPESHDVAAKPCGGALTFGELARLRRELEPLVLADCEACGGCGQVVWSNAAEAYVPAPHVHVGGGDTERRGEKCPACVERAVLAWIDGQAESEAAS